MKNLILPIYTALFILMLASCQSWEERERAEYDKAMNDLEEMIADQDSSKAEDVLKVLGGSKISLKKLYGFCNASEAIKNRIREVNESRPFTEEAARNWAILEDILELQPERPISEIINDVQVSRKTFYDLKRKDGESARGVQNP